MAFAGDLSPFLSTLELLARRDLLLSYVFLSPEMWLAFRFPLAFAPLMPKHLYLFFSRIFH